MVNFRCFLFFLQIVGSLLILCAFNVHGEEKLFIPFDNRAWKIGFKNNSSDESIIEMILQNEDINNWQELFTVQRFKEISISAKEFVSLLEKRSRVMLPPNETLRFKILKPDPANIFESSFISNYSNADPSTISNNEYNIGRVIKGKNALYYFRYSTKDADQFDKNLNQWIKKLEMAYIASTPQTNQGERWLAFTPKGVADQTLPLNYQTDYQFIENPQFPFGLSLPKQWNVKEQTEKNPSTGQSDEKEILAFSNSDENIEGRVSVLPPPPKSADTITASSSYLAAYQKKHPEAKLISKGKLTTITGQKGFYFIFSDRNKKGWIALFSDQEHTYSLEFWTTQERFDALKNQFKNISLNFQLKSETF